MPTPRPLPVAPRHPLHWLLAAALAFGASCSPTTPSSRPVPLPTAADTAAATVHITILHLNDVYEITPVEGGKSGGLARVATVLKQLKRANPNTVTTLAGDFLSPSAIGTALVDGAPLDGRQMVAILNAVGVDLVTFGNHEFDLAPSILLQRIGESRFSYVASNVTDSAGQPFAAIPTRRILSFSNLHGRVARLGVISATIDVNQRPYVRYLPFVPAAQREARVLRDSVDGLIALTHLTLIGDHALVDAIPELDLVLGGHEHDNWQFRRGPRFTPIVKADANVRSVWIVELDLMPGRRIKVETRLLVIDDAIPEDPIVAAAVKEWTDKAYDGFRREGFEPTRVIAEVPEPLDGRDQPNRSHPTNLGTLIADAILAQGEGADAAFVNGGSIRLDDVLLAGPLTEYDVIRILPFGNKVVEVAIKGSLLARVLDQGVANRGSGGFLHHAKIIAGPQGWEIGGQPLDRARTYSIMTSDFLVNGRERGLEFLNRSNLDLTVQQELRDVRLALIDELRRRWPSR